MSRGTTLIPVSCAIIKRDDGKVLFLKRYNTGWMDGYYALPGGHLEGDENFSQALCRELLEEVGITVDPADLQFSSVMNMLYDTGNRINVTFLVTKWSGEAINAEPSRSSEIAWFDPQQLPENTVEYDVTRVQSNQPYQEYGWE